MKIFNTTALSIIHCLADTNDGVHALKENHFPREILKLLQYFDKTHKVKEAKKHYNELMKNKLEDRLKMLHSFNSRLR